MLRGAFSAALLLGLLSCSVDARDRSTTSRAGGAPVAGTGDANGDPSRGAMTDGGSGASEGGENLDSGTNRDAPPDGERAPFHLVGRTDRRSAAGPRFGWPGTEIRTRVSGAGIAIELADTGVSYYDVTVDGAASGTLVVSGPARRYEVAAGAGLHDVVLTKRTESATGVTQLSDLVALPGGSIVPSPAPSGRRIEVIGDSITCGYGVLGPDARCPFSPATESEPLAWGSLAARELGALHAVIAISGIGVFRNYRGETTETMPARYGRAIADDATSTWDPRGFAPDVVVVALGTNDFAGGKGDPGPAFEAAYTAFLATLRATHPSAHLALATSPMLSGGSRVRHRVYLDGALAARRAAGDARVSFLDVGEQLEADGLACDFHPSRATQAKMGALLAAHLRAVLGW